MAISRQARNAQKRLSVLLSDEEYGPKLARLNRTNERYILDLIWQNKGKEARAELNRLDRERQTTSRARRTAAKLSPGLAREELFIKLRSMWALQAKWSSSTMSRRIDAMTDDQVYKILAMPSNDIESTVRQSNPVPEQWADDTRPEHNVLWYHPNAGMA